MGRQRKRRKVAAITPGRSRREWREGDLVLAKLRGYRPWPAQIQTAEDYGYESRRHKLFVTFFGTEEISFCSQDDVKPFTADERKNLLEKLLVIDEISDFGKAIREICATDDDIKSAALSKFASEQDEDLHSTNGEEPLPYSEKTSKRTEFSQHDKNQANVGGIEDGDTIAKSADKHPKIAQKKVRIKVLPQYPDPKIQPDGQLCATNKTPLEAESRNGVEREITQAVSQAGQKPKKRGDKDSKGKVKSVEQVRDVACRQPVELDKKLNSKHAEVLPFHTAPEFVKEVQGENSEIRHDAVGSKDGDRDMADEEVDAYDVDIDSEKEMEFDVKAGRKDMGKEKLAVEAMQSVEADECSLKTVTILGTGTESLDSGAQSTGAVDASYSTKCSSQEADPILEESILMPTAAVLCMSPKESQETEDGAECLIRSVTGEVDDCPSKDSRDSIFESEIFRETQPEHMH